MKLYLLMLLTDVVMYCLLCNFDYSLEHSTKQILNLLLLSFFIISAPIYKYILKYMSCAAFVGKRLFTRSNVESCFCICFLFSFFY